MDGRQKLVCLLVKRTKGQKSVTQCVHANKFNWFEPLLALTIAQNYKLKRNKYAFCCTKKPKKMKKIAERHTTTKCFVKLICLIQTRERKKN